MPQYDYIVIGSGSAGAALAARLTEDPDIKVLLLEAGGRDNHPLQVAPLPFLKVVASPHHTYLFESEPEPGLNGRRLPIRRGKSLGGTSSINAMIAIRGNPRDFDVWAQKGATGWSYADVLPYFKRLENHWRGDSEHHSSKGPVAITPVDFPEMFYEPLREAAIQAGFPVSEDANGAQQEGLSRMDASVGKSGQRSSTARAYLRPAAHRPNLTIKTNAPLRKILIENGRCIGVAYAHDGMDLIAHADREVVLSAGGYHSPQLLMLSGIGPANHLREFGIPVVHDLPGVGQDLQDHPNVINVFRLKAQGGLTPHLRLDRAAMGFARWALTGTGIFASNGAAANIFLKGAAEQERPNIQLVPMPVDSAADLWGAPGLKPRTDPVITVRVGAPLHPRSKGWVKLGSANPDAAPRIQFNMFTDPADMAEMIKAIRLSRELFSQPAMSKLWDLETAPGPDVTSDADLETYIRATASHRSHPTSTCRMGVDAMAVVDPELKVHGLQGLRIADASIMPDVPGGNTNLPSIMIGEKAADLLRM